MARESKAQREARLELVREGLLASAKATYTDRLMSLLARATKENFELEVKERLFKVEDRDSRRSSPFFLMPRWTDESDLALYELEMAVEFKEEERAEREQKAQARAAALSKLSKEERELLGL